MSEAEGAGPRQRQCARDDQPPDKDQTFVDGAAAATVRDPRRRRVRITAHGGYRRRSRRMM
jgi:hypothetical protein